jgi:nucleotide-binding universal stress UspA family protein
VAINYQLASGRRESRVEYFDVKAKAKTEGRSSSPGGIETLLVPTDFSEESLKALSYARALLNYFPGAAHLVYVHDVDFAYAVPALMSTSPMIATEEVERRYRKDLAKLAKQFDLSGSRLEQHVRAGRAYQEISELASKVGAQLIVIATHGRTGLRRLMLGSTAERVVRHAPCPVLVVREREREFFDLGKGKSGAQAALHISKILVPVDFSDSSREGLLYAISFARRFDASLILLHAIQVQPFIPAEGHAVHERMPAPGVIERAARLRARKFLKEVDFGGVNYEMEIQAGAPAHEICRFAENASVELIITSTHGQTGLAHALIGSTAEHVVRYAHSPVLVVPTSEASGQRQRDLKKAP